MASETGQADSLKVFSDTGNLSIEDRGHSFSKEDNQEASYNSHGGVCAICLNNIALQETALVKGCEHAYCVMCILRWTTFTTTPSCPKCKLNFEFLCIHRSLDGRIEDYMFEESVCLLQRASWFKPQVVEHEEHLEVEEAYNLYECDDGCNGDSDMFEDYFGDSSSSGPRRIGNRRWGDNGYVRAGRQEAWPARRSHAAFANSSSSSSSSSSHKKETPTKSSTGRRAKRALKREASSN